MPAKKSTVSCSQPSETALFNYIKKGNTEEIVSMLLDITEDPDTGVRSAKPKPHAGALVNTQGPKKLTSLSYAVSQDADDETLHTLLLAGAKIDAKDATKEQSTALHAACWGECDTAIQLLLRCGANPVVTDAEGRTPLHILASLNARNLFMYFIEAVTTRTERQEGLLYLNGHPPIVLDVFDLLGRRDVSGFTVLHTAVSEVGAGSDTVIADLLEVMEAHVGEKSKSVGSFVNCPTESKSTALHFLLGSQNCHERYLMGILHRLLALGASVTCVDEFGQTPLTVAVITQTSSTAAGAVVTALLQSAQKEAETKGKSEGDELLEQLFTLCDDNKGYALIHHAIAARNVEAIKAMITFLKTKDKSRVREWIGEVQTAEHVNVATMLAFRQCDDIARFLIEADAISCDAYEQSRTAFEATAEESRLTLEKKEAADRELETAQEGEGTKANMRGDFSGFGANSVGSRIQNSRKAKAQTAQKRKMDHDRIADSGKLSDDMPLWAKILGVLFALSMLMGGLLMIKGGK